MRGDELQQFIGDACCHIGKLLEVQGVPFVVESVPADGITPSSYETVFEFAEKQFRVALTPDMQPNILLCSVIDIIEHRIEKGKTFLATSCGAFYLRSTQLPCSSGIEWGDDIYLELQNQLALRFRNGLGIQFQLLDALATQNYEGDRCSGSIAFVDIPKRKLNSIVEISIEAKGGICFNIDMLRQIRKLLAGAGTRCLLFQWEGDHYVCLGYCQEEAVKQLGCLVRFSNAPGWTLYDQGCPLFRYSHSGPKVISDTIASVVEELKRQFSPGSYDWEKARELLIGASNQHHGTALIFADFNTHKIRRRVSKLHKLKRAMKFTKGAGSTGKTVESLSRMDGAIFIDIHKMCISYFAAIVDGQAVEEGDLARGARHNSIKTFISDLTKGDSEAARSIFAVVFSEDGGAVSVKNENF